MLATFLSSEGIKNSKIGYSWVMIVLGVLQIVRIFIYPMKAHAATVTIQEQAVIVMETRQFIFCVIWLLASAVCLLAGAVIGMIRSRQLQSYLASLDAKTA